jgi:anti-sigma factor RsiW
VIGWRRTTPCERASQWISLELDGELSDLERAGLDRHVERCESCRALRVEMSGLTALLRGAPLAESGREVTVVTARRRRARAASRIGFVTAVGGIAAVVAALVTSSPSDLLGGQPSALSFVNQREQIRFAHSKYMGMEPLRHLALAQAPTASVPANSRRALR